MISILKKWDSMIKVFWFVGIVGFVFSGMALPLIPKAILVFTLLISAIIYEFTPVSRKDERQVQISRSSSHAAYWVYTLLTLFVIFREWNKNDSPPDIIFFLLLFVPLTTKLIVSIAFGYGTLRGIGSYVMVFFRGLLPVRTIDERQIKIGDLSSHVAFYAYLLLSSVYVVFYTVGHPGDQWFMLLIVPLLAKAITSLAANFGIARAVRIGLFGLSFFWLLFVFLSHGLSIVAIIESAPFLIIFLLALATNKFPMIVGIALIIAGVLILFLSQAWSNFQIYTRILMLSLIPIPLIISGTGMIIERFKRNSEKEVEM